MKVQNMTSSRGNPVANQFIIASAKDGNPCETFQSYRSVIAEIVYWVGNRKVTLDTNKWDYSITTGKYRNQFLGETKKETQAKIDSGEYILADLNA